MRRFVNAYAYVSLFLACLCLGCSSNPTDKYQMDRDRVVSVKDKIVPFETDSVLVGGWNRIYLFDDYLVIQDYKSLDNQLYIFDKDNFRCLAANAPLGQGPGEIAGIGTMVYDEERRSIYVSDHGANKIFCYMLDSLLADPFYQPQLKMRMKPNLFPSEYQIVNDTLVICRMIQLNGTRSFSQYTANWDMESGEFARYEDLHPEIEQKRYMVAASATHDLVVESYYERENLMVLRHLDGKLKHNVYGKEKKSAKQMDYFQGTPVITDRFIIIGYVDDTSFTVNEQGNPIGRPARQLIVFNLEGDYIRTLNLGYNLNNFCYNKENDRLYMSFNDEIQFGYLDLAGIL